MAKEKITTEKYYTSQEILDEYSSKSCKAKNSILYEALDYMQQHNNRTKLHCIALVMGYKNYEGEPNTYTKN